MISSPVLRDRHRRTLSAVFAHPAAHNLAWADVLSLLGQVGAVTEEANGKLRSTVAGHSVSWEPEGSQLREEDVLALRQFLQSVQVTPEAATATAPAAPSGRPGRRATVVMTYRDARVLGDGESVLVEPLDPRGHLQHMHEKGGQRRGVYHQPQPEYFARISDAFRGYDEVLLLGHGKGHSNAMMQLVAYLDRREPELAQRVVGGVDLDVGDLTEADVDRAVHEFFGESVRPSAR
jgi:hypothetical protein